MGFLGVALGAFGAHALRDRLDPYSLGVFEVGVRYQMYHAAAMLGVAWASERFGGGAIRAAGWLFLVGVVVFSGSLYALALSGVKAWGAVTPIGGAALLAGWMLLAIGALRRAPGTGVRS